MPSTLTSQCVMHLRCWLLLYLLQQNIALDHNICLQAIIPLTNCSCMLDTLLYCNDVVLSVDQDSNMISHMRRCDCHWYLRPQNCGLFCASWSRVLEVSSSWDQLDKNCRMIKTWDGRAKKVNIILVQRNTTTATFIGAVHLVLVVFPTIWGLCAGEYFMKAFINHL